MQEVKLRDGYTTGSCAAAAARAAAVCWLKKNAPKKVSLCLADGNEASFAVEAVPFWESPFTYNDDFYGFLLRDEGVCFRVQKDAGDDPDITNGAYIYAAFAPLSESAFFKLKQKGRGYVLEGDTAIYLDGGPGVGIVTLKGLSCPPGHYAINPGPQKAIATAVGDVCKACDKRGPFLTAISIPDGEKLAERTFNPKLGIKGGLSVLGTTGMVHPMSEEALVSTIRLELHMRAAAGNKSVILVPGNYGETFLEENFAIPKGTAVQCSNFVKDSVTMAVDEGFNRIIFAGHIGKLIKVAAGMGNTHSRYGDARMETVISLLSDVITVDDSLSEKILSSPTTDEALHILSEITLQGGEDECNGNSFCTASQALLTQTAMAVKRQLQSWAGPLADIDVYVFSNAVKETGSTLIKAGGI